MTKTLYGKQKQVYNDRNSAFEQRKENIENIEFKRGVSRSEEPI